MALSSAPRGKTFSYISPPFRRTATARSTRVRPWSSICSKAPRAFRRATSSAPPPSLLLPQLPTLPLPAGGFFIALVQASSRQPSPFCHSDRSRSASEGGVEEPVVRLRDR